MATAQDLLAWQLDHLGEHEQPDGSNHVPGITDVNGFWDDSWCVMWISDGYVAVGLPSAGASCYYAIRRFQSGELGTWVGKPDITAIKAGDQGFGGPGGNDHTWTVAAVDVASRRILCYEGNWSNQSLAQWRNYDDPWIFGFGRPAYDVGTAVVEPPAPADPLPGNAPLDFASFQPSLNWYVRRNYMTGATIWVMQLFYNELAGRDLVVDGVYGPATAAATEDFQRFFGLTPDRIVGPITATVQHNCAVLRGWSPF